MGPLNRRNPFAVGTLLATALSLLVVAAVVFPFTQTARAATVEFFDRGLVFSEEEKAALTHIVERAVAEARVLLPGLPSAKIRVTVESDPELSAAGYAYSHTGFAWSKSRIGLYVDPAIWQMATLDEPLEMYVRYVVFHEMHHGARGWTFVSDRPATVADAVVSEGMATAFGRDVSGVPAAQLDEGTLLQFIDKVLALPPDAPLTVGNLQKVVSSDEWDGGSGLLPLPGIVYAAGTYVVDLAMDATGLSAAQLVSATPEEVFKMAGLR